MKRALGVTFVVLGLAFIVIGLDIIYWGLTNVYFPDPSLPEEPMAWLYKVPLFWGILCLVGGIIGLIKGGKRAWNMTK